MGEDDVKRSRASELEVFTWCGRDLRWWSIMIGMVHLVMCVAVIVLLVLQTQDIIRPSRLITPVTRTVGLWVQGVANDSPPVQLGSGVTLHPGCSVVNPWKAAQDSYQIEPIILNFGTMDTRVIIIVFFALSGLFQIVGALQEKSYYSELLLGFNHISHFVEYSISASILALGVSAQLGVTDFFTLLGVVSNTWSCMMFGLLAEVLYQDATSSEGGKKIARSLYFIDFRISYYWVAHYAGWVAMLSGAAVAGSNLINFHSCIQRDDGDKFWIIGQVAAWFEIIIFLCFGLVQMISFAAKPDQGGLDDKAVYDRRWYASVTEFSYIMLSLTAKLGLGIMVYTANFI
jgi:hypothetical protein